MASLSSKIRQYVNKEIDFTKEVILQDDGQGPYIKKWNLDISKPTDAELDALESQANIYESNLQQDEKRKYEYGNWEYQLDEIYHQGIDVWKTRIQSIKNKYPKE
jgi:hypothetical protein